MRVSPLALFFIVNCLSAFAADSSYFQDVRPILQSQCQGCHQPASQSSGLDLTTFEGFAKGGKHGPAFKAGAAAESLILKYLRGEAQPVMPLGGTPLSNRSDRCNCRLDRGGSERRHASRSRGHHLGIAPALLRAASRHQRSGVLAGRTNAGRFGLSRSVAAQGGRQRPGRQTCGTVGTAEQHRLIPPTEIADRRRRHPGPLR